MENHTPDRPLAGGQRVFTCGHSFHFWVADLLVDLANGVGIQDHRTIGTSAIGGSRVIQHWDVPEEQNEAKKALQEGNVDVLTLSCMTRPDEGIRKFARLAVRHNSNIRVTLQELWLPEDRFPFDPANRVRHSPDEYNDSTMADLKTAHAAYFKVMEDYVSTLNDELGKQFVFIVPDAQATLALREKIIAGTVPGVENQSDLFTDAWGHPSSTLRMLSAYCHFFVIYRRSAVGLPSPGALSGEPGGDDALNRILQQLAWDAVTQHPLSGDCDGTVQSSG